MTQTPVLIRYYRHVSSQRYLAIGHNLPGLVVECDSMEEVDAVIDEVVPELIKANGVQPLSLESLNESVAVEASDNGDGWIPKGARIPSLAIA